MFIIIFKILLDCFNFGIIFCHCTFSRTFHFIFYLTYLVNAATTICYVCTWNKLCSYIILLYNYIFSTYFSKYMIWFFSAGLSAFFAINSSSTVQECILQIDENSAWWHSANIHLSPNKLYSRPFAPMDYNVQSELSSIEMRKV